jgi:tetratricopeptide (TPR) repeat protein
MTTDKQSAFKRLLEDLKRRHVVRVAIGYIIFAWVILQVADVILPSFEVGDWVFRALVIAAFIGFFVTVILAWVFDISDKHIVKTEGKALPRWVRSVISIPLIIIVGAGGWWVWSGYVTEKESSIRPTEINELPIVAVMPFRNLTGDPEIGWYSEGLANLVRDNLTRSKYLRVVSPQKLKSIIGEAADIASISELCEQEGIGFILSGEMLITPAGTSVTSRLSDTAGGVDLSARQSEGLTAETLLSAAGPIAAQVKQGLNVPRTEQIDIFAADFTTQNLSAYESYVAGLGFFLNFQYKKAEQAFNAALQLAPDFAVARYRLAYIQAATGRTEMAQENIGKALTVANIPEREKLYIEAAQALFSRDYQLASESYEALLADYPFEVEARELLAKSYWGQYRAEDAVRELQLLATEEPQNKVVWSTLGGYLLAMGEFDRAQPALERYAKLAPDDANSFTLLGDSLRYQGQFDAARSQYALALEIDPKMREVAASLATIDYLEGNYGEAEQEFAAIVADESLIVRERLDAMFPLQALLSARGDFAAADSLIKQFSEHLKEEKIREAMAASIRALLQLETGNLAAASELVNSAISLSPGVPTRYLFARGLIELSRKDYTAVSTTAQEIMSFALPPDDPDRTEERAASYLTGMAWLEKGELENAETDLQKAVNLGGYQYRIYELGLARLMMHKNQASEALELVGSAAVPKQVDPRVDLEPERVRALLLSAQIMRQAGLNSEATGFANRFLSRFDMAPPSHPLNMLALEIIADTGVAQNPDKKKDDSLAVLFE